MTPTIGVSHADARKKIVEALKSENWNVTGLNEYNAIQKRASFMALTFVALIIIYSLSFDSNNEGNRAMRPGLLFCLIVYAVSALISLASYFLRSRTLNKEMSHTVHHLIHHFETSVHQHENSGNETHMPTSSALPHDAERLVKLMSGHSHLSIINVFRDSTWQKLPAVLLVEGDLVALMGGDVTPCKVQQLKDELVVIPPSKKPESRWNLGSILEAGDLIPVDIININPEPNEEMSEGLSSKVGSVRYPSSVAGSERGGSTAAAAAASTNTAQQQQQLRNRVITPESLEILKFSGNMRCFVVLENPVVQVIRLLLTRAQERKEKTFFTNVRHQTEEIMAYVAIGSLLVCGCIVVLKRIFGFVYFANILLTVLVPMISLLVIFAPPNLWLLENMIETFGTAAVLASRWVLMSAPNAKKKTTDFDVDEEFDDHPMPSDRKRSDSKPISTNGDGSLHPEVTHPHATAATTGEQEAWSKTPFHFTPKTDQDGWLKATFRSNPVRLIGHSHSILAYVTKVLQRRWRITFDATTADAPIASITTTTTSTTSTQDDQFTLPFESSNFSEELGSISMVCFIDDDIICENNAVCEEVLLMGEENNELSTATTPTPKRSTTEALAKSIREHNTTNHAKCLVMDLHSGTVENGKRFENPLWWQQLPSLKPLGLACLMNHAGSTMDMSTTTSSSSSSMIPMMSPVSSSESFAVTAAAATNSMGEASLVDASATTTGKFTHKSSAPVPFTSSTPSPLPPPPSVTQIKHHLVHHVRRNLPMPFLKDLSEEIGFQATDAANFTKLFEINVLSPKLDQEYLSQESHQMSLEESKRRGFLMPKLRSTLCKDTRGGFQMIGVGDPALVLSYCKEYWDGNTRTITPLSPADREEILQFYERWRLEDFEVVAFAYTPVPDSPHLESFIRHSQVDPATAITRPPMATLSAASLAAMATANAAATATATAANTTTTATGGGGSNGNLASGSGSGHHHHVHHHMHHHHSHGGGNGDSSSYIGPKPLYFVDLTTCVDGKATPTTTAANGLVGETTADATGHAAPGTMQSAAEITTTLSATSSGVTLQPFQSGYSHHTHDDDSGHEDSSPEKEEGNGRHAIPRVTGQPLDTVVEEGGYEHESGRGDSSGSGRAGGGAAGGACGEDAERPQQQAQPHQGHLESPTSKQRRNNGGKGSMPEPAGSGWKSTGSKSPSAESNTHNHHSNSSSTNSYINNNINANNAAGAKQPMRSSPDDEEEEDNDEVDEVDGRKDEFDGEEGPDDLNTAAVMNEPGDEDGDEGDGDGDGDGDDACDGLTPECDGDEIDASASSKRQRHQSGRERFGTISDGENDGDGDGEGEGGGRGRLGSTTGAVQGEGDTAGGRGSGDDEEDDNDWMMAYEQMAITRATTEPTGIRQTLRALEKAHGKYDEDDDENEEGTGNGQDDGQGRPMGGQRRSHRRRTSSASSTASVAKQKSSPSRSNGRPRSSTDDIDEEAMGDDGDGDGDGDEEEEEETTTTTVGFRRVATEPPMHLHGTHHGSSHREVNVGGRLPLPKALSVNKALDGMDQPQQQQQQLVLQSRRRSSTTAGDSSTFTSSPSPLLMTMKSSSEKHGRALTKSTSIDGFTSSLMSGDALHDDERMAGEEDEEDDDVNDDENHHHRTGDDAASMTVDRTHAASGSPIEGHGSISGATTTGSRMRSSSSKVRTSTGTSSSRRSGKTQGPSNATSKGGEAVAANGSSSGIDFHRHASDQLMLFKKSNNKRELKAVNRLHARGLNALSELHLRQVKRLTYRSLWNITRQQIFLGMVASSVPVREDVPVLKEALDAAGVRFIYFSPRNMKRSKPIAEKIGIPFDWNCAISLRDLGDANVIDPHRHISSYADWDVLARMPHGIEAIKRHIREVDNVPLLVSLFTDSTPTTIRQMLEIFREYGETVLAIGSGYRCYHSDIFHSANIASSIATLPGVVPSIASKEQTLFDRFPKYDRYALSQMDIELAFRLVGLGTFNLIQCEEINGTNKTADLSKLVQLIRVGRQILENQFQIFGFVVTVMVALALTVLLLHFVPLSTAPFLPIPMLMVYLLIYVPLLAWALLFVRNANDLLKNTPRKRLFVLKKADRDRFAWYLGLRASAVAVSAYVAGLLTTASVFRSAIYHRNAWGQQHAVSMMRSLSAYHTIFAAAGSDRSMWLRDLKSYWFIQDVVMNTVLMSLLVQCWTMQTRGYSVLAKKTTKWDGKWLLLLTMGVIVLVQVGIMTYRALLRSCFHDVDTTAVWFLSGMDCDVPQGAGSDYAAYDELHWSCWLAMFIVAPLLNLIVAEYVNAQDLKLRTRHLQFLRLEFDTRLGMHSPR